MREDNQTKKQLVHELTELRSQNSVLKRSITEGISAKVEAEEASRYAESIVETIRQPLLVLDADLKIISANRNFYRTFEVTPSDTIGSFIYDLGNKQWDIPKLRELLETILPEKVTFDNYEVEHDFATIGRRIMLLNARQIQRVLGKERIILLAIEDITERKRLEDLLIESEERFRRLFETASDGIVLLEKQEGKITNANPATETMLGYTQKDSIGSNLQEIGILLDMGDFQTTMRNLNKIGIINYDDVVVETKSGKHIDTEIYLVDRAKLVQCNIRNVTERKQTEEALRESDEKFRTIFDMASDGILVTDAITKKILQWNPSMCSMLGYTKEEVESLTINDIHPPKDIAHILDEFEKQANGEKVLAEDLPVLRKDGSIFYADISSSRANIRGVPCLLGIFRDITDRKCAEEEKAKFEIQLRQSHKMEAIGTLAGGIAHDFNNILAAIIGYAELSLVEDRKEIQHQYLQETLNGAERAKDLVKQILTFSRQDSREKKPLDIKLLLKEAANFLRASIPATIEIQQRFTDESCNILADHTQMYQVIINLCTNASHSMKQSGGILTIELFTMELAKGDILHNPGLKPGPYVKLTVSDTGCGIDPAIIQSIFDPFFTTKSKDEGTGLGLSVAYGIIKSHNGVINVYSELGKGASFSIYLPRIMHEAVTNGNIFGPVIGGTEQILFVDDEPALVEISMLMMSSLGYKVTGVTSSNEALDLFRAEPKRFDLVITDMTLPKMTGIDLSREILQIRPDMSIILCSGLRGQETEEQVKSLGIRAYCTKPLTRKDLSRVIRETLDKK